MQKLVISFITPEVQLEQLQDLTFKLTCFFIVTSDNIIAHFINFGYNTANQCFFKLGVRARRKKETQKYLLLVIEVESDSQEQHFFSCSLIYSLFCFILLSLLLEVEESWIQLTLQPYEQLLIHLQGRSLLYSGRRLGLWVGGECYTII